VGAGEREGGRREGRKWEQQEYLKAASAVTGKSRNTGRRRGRTVDGRNIKDVGVVRTRDGRLVVCA